MQARLHKALPIDPFLIFSLNVLKIFSTLVYMSHISYFLICISQHTSQDFNLSDLMDTASVGGKRKRSDTLCTESKPPQTRLNIRSQAFDINDSDLAAGPLCVRCASVDFDAALSSEQEAFLIQDLGPINQWSITSCTLCKLLDSLMPEWMRKIPNGLLLRTINSYSAQVKRDIPLLQALPPTKLLGLCGRASTKFIALYLIPQFKGFEPVRLLKTGSIDFSVLKDWLYLCQTMHTRVCNAQRREEISLQHFKLIDCHTHQIVTADHADYVALSYVWGPTEDCHEFSEQLPATLPWTIEDAITVTQNLGLRCIWIDRYCINQKQKGHAYLQMSQMDLIYQNAIVTIVAAAGKDPSYGLPGVSRRERRPQLRARIRSTVFINHWPTPNLLSRTLIGLVGVGLSKKHYYLDGVLYSLMSKYILNVTYGRQVPACTGLRRRGICIRSRYNPKFHLQPDRRIFKQVLTHQSDRLYAFLGIIRVFETQGTYHCWGTPILAPPFVPGKKPSKQDLNSGFLRGLCWTLMGPSHVRIQSLPSWSWTSWSGTVWHEDNTLEGPTSVVKASVELRDGSVLDWSEHRRRYAEINNSVQLSHFIHVLAPTFEIHNLSKATSQWYTCEIRMNDGWFLQWKFLFYQDGGILSQCQKCFVMASDIKSEKFIVLLKQCEIVSSEFGGAGHTVRTSHCYVRIARSLLYPTRSEVISLNDMGWTGKYL